MPTALLFRWVYTYYQNAVPPGLFWHLSNNLLDAHAIAIGTDLMD